MFQLNRGFFSVFAFWSALVFGPTQASAQIIDFAVESVQFYEEVKIRIVDFYEDETWEVVGACSNPPNLKARFVDFHEDVQVRIVQFYGDRKVCITNAEDLEYKMRVKLGL